MTDPRLPLKIFFATTAANHPGGRGYWEIEARTRAEAHDKAMDPIYGLGTKWSMMYTTLDQVHPDDRVLHGRIK